MNWSHKIEEVQETGAFEDVHDESILVLGCVVTSSLTYFFLVDICLQFCQSNLLCQLVAKGLMEGI